MDHPFFSIIIPTYNRASLLPGAINSVLNQIYTNWELLIIDDGSTDQTEIKVKEIKDQRIRYFYKDHEERSIARNYGIDRAKGRYLCFLDSDDYFLEDHLEKHFRYLDEHCYSEIVLYSGTWVEEGGKRWKYPHLGASDNVIRSLWFTGYNLLPFSFSKKLIGDLRFDPQLNFMEDLDFLLSMYKQNSWYFLDDFSNTVVNHDQRSLSTRYNTKILKKGVEHCLGIDRIIEKHKEQLLSWISEKEIKEKKMIIQKSFLRAAVKKLRVISFIRLLIKC